MYMYVRNNQLLCQCHWHNKIRYGKQLKLPLSRIPCTTHHITAGYYLYFMNFGESEESLRNNLIIKKNDHICAVQSFADKRNSIYESGLKFSSFYATYRSKEIKRFLKGNIQIFLRGFWFILYILYFLRIFQRNCLWLSNVQNQDICINKQQPVKNF